MWQSSEFRVYISQNRQADQESPHGAAPSEQRATPLHLTSPTSYECTCTTNPGVLQMRRLPSRPKGRQAYVYTPPPTLLQQHKRGAAYVITLPPSTPAPVRPPPAPPGRCPEPASATTRPQRSRAADNGHRRAALKLGAVAGASLRALPPQNGGLGTEDDCAIGVRVRCP